MKLINLLNKDDSLMIKNIAISSALQGGRAAATLTSDRVKRSWNSICKMFFTFSALDTCKLNHGPSVGEKSADYIEKMVPVILKQHGVGAPT